jgi:hypothetical protein
LSACITVIAEVVIILGDAAFTRVAKVVSARVIIIAIDKLAVALSIRASTRLKACLIVATGRGVFGNYPFRIGERRVTYNTVVLYVLLPRGVTNITDEAGPLLYFEGTIAIAKARVGCTWAGIITHVRSPLALALFIADIAGRARVPVVADITDRAGLRWGA